MGCATSSLLGDASASASFVPAEYAAVARAVRGVLRDPAHDDGSLGPVLVRLAWHSCGTYDRESGTGGSRGATMRFAPERDDPENKGLDLSLIHI